MGTDMPLQRTRLMNLEFSEKLHTYTAHDTMLYALSVGLGFDPLDRKQLAFVYERDLRAFPPMAHVLGMETDWLYDPANGIDLTALLHFESGLTQFQPLPSQGTVKSRLVLTDILDRGLGKGAILSFERELRDAASDTHLATASGKFLLRADGGFAEEPRRTAPPAHIPERAPDLTCDLPTLPQSALIYRLNNDLNPLHVDPAVAQRAGFDGPILHGACTYAVACHAFIRTVLDYDETRLRRIDTRFSAPVMPGDTVRSEFWRIGEREYAFTARAVERDVLVLGHGVAEHY